MAMGVKIQRLSGSFGESGSSNDFKEGNIFGRIMLWFCCQCVRVHVCEGQIENTEED